MNASGRSRRRLKIAHAIAHRLPPFLAQRLRTILYPRHVAMHDPCEFEVRLPTGSTFAHHTADYHSYHVAVLGYFNWRNIAIASASDLHGKTCIEIGANVGTETIAYADIIGPDGTVLCFEPLQENVTVLRSNIARNHLENVQVFSSVVSSSCGVMTFLVPEQEQTSGRGFVAGTEKTDSASTWRQQSVEAVTLDSIADSAGQVAALFIDAEGSEYDIIAGGREFLRRNRPTIVLEAVQKLLLRSGKTTEDLYRCIADLEYSIFEITRFGLRKITPATIPDDSDWYCVPSAREHEADRIRKALLRGGFMPRNSRWNPLKR